MAKFRVNAKVIIDGVEAGSGEEAVARVAQAFSATLMVISATARPALKSDKGK